MKFTPIAFSMICIITLSLMGCKDSNEYHEAKMKSAYKAMYVNSEQQGTFVASSIDENQQKKYEKHRNILIDRGVLFKQVYVFANVRPTTEQARKLIKTLLRSPPYFVVDFRAPHTNENQSLQITLWGRQEDKEGWDKFMKSYDMPAQPPTGGDGKTTPQP